MQPHERDVDNTGQRHAVFSRSTNKENNHALDCSIGMTQAAK